MYVELNWKLLNVIVRVKCYSSFNFVNLPFTPFIPLLPCMLDLKTLSVKYFFHFASLSIINLCNWTAFNIVYSFSLIVCWILKFDLFDLLFMSGISSIDFFSWRLKLKTNYFNFGFCFRSLIIIGLPNKYIPENYQFIPCFVCCIFLKQYFKISLSFSVSEHQQFLQVICPRYCLLDLTLCWIG